MDVDTLPVKLLADTIEDLDAVVDRLRREEADIQKQLSEVRSRREQWQKILGTRSGDAPPRTRAKKGENEGKIAAFYDSRPSEGFTLPELAKQTGISSSSTRNVLTKNVDGAFEERDGKWFKNL